MAQETSSREEVKRGPAAEVICFGMITPAVVMIVAPRVRHSLRP